jgi:delta-aminolevulinic acid dehydratase/porphobilinogen synthase
VLSGERWRSESGSAGRRDWRLLTEMFTMLRRAGASQIITYAAAGVAAALG